MRRLVFPTIVAIGLVMVGSSSASAEDPTPAPTVSAKSTPGKKLCKIGDEELTELSGLVATKNGFVTVNDGTEGVTPKIYFLNRECKKVKEAAFAGTPLDVEDIALSPDGQTLWIADIGDNNVRTDPASTRPHVALWSLPVSGTGEAAIHRVSYPDKDRHDAEALIFDGDGTPMIVTKEIGAPAGIYKPAAALKKNSTTPVPMKRVGEITLAATETPGNVLARIGNKTITGGAVTQGTTKVALRTYTDALEWDVTGGDVVGALKKEPRTTGLPNEPLGEAIAYSPDGSLFYTVSDMSGDKAAANHIREYTPATTVAVKSEKSGKRGSSGSWYSDLSIDDITYIVGGVGVLGLLLVGVGVFGIVRFRRSPRGLATASSDDLPSGGFAKGDPETELIGVGGAPQRGAAYSSGRQGGGPVYGAQSGPSAAGGGPQRGAAGAGPGAGSGGPQYGRPAGQPPRGPQQAQPRNPQPVPGAGPKQPPARGGQPVPGAGPKQPPARGGQPVPGAGPKQPPARGGQPVPGAGPKQPPAGRGQQPPPGRGPQQVPGRGGQQPPRGPQQAPGRGPQQPPSSGRASGVYGGQKQPPRGPQG